MNGNTASEVAASKAESLEEMDSMEELEWLEVKVTSDIDGTLLEIHIVLTVGGPHIEVNVSSGTVTAMWDEEHTTHFNNEDLQNQLWDYFSRQWEMAEPNA